MKKIATPKVAAGHAFRGYDSHHGCPTCGIPVSLVARYCSCGAHDSVCINADCADHASLTKAMPCVKK